MGFDEYEIDVHVCLCVFRHIKVNLPESCLEH